jgi:thiol-disulfide isomerase/thioredoxin
VKRIWLAIGAVALVAMLAIGLSQAGGGGSDEPRSTAPGAAEQVAQLEGAPEPLAAVHAQANTLLGGGADAFEERLAQLKGYPVVVNKWASWCGPCRAEFPDFQRSAVRHGKQVAFLGVNSNDNREEADAFLRRYPVSYPSYEDPSGEVAQVFNGAAAFPTTVFYDRAGKLAYVHQGQYLSGEKLEEDIRRYALR